MKCNDLAAWLQQNLFKHIELNNLWAARVNMIKPFIRSDLILKKWHLMSAQKVWIGNSKFEISKDSIFLVIKDHSVKVKNLELGVDNELIYKYASNDYVTHILSQKETSKMVVDDNIRKSSDPLFEAAKANKPDYGAKAKAGKKEVGVKIKISQPGAVGAQEQEDKKSDEAQGAVPRQIEGDYVKAKRPRGCPNTVPDVLSIHK